MLIFYVSLSANDYSITIESSNDLVEWHSIHAVTIHAEPENKFYRAIIGKIEEPLSILEDSTLTVTQTWSQETNYLRTAHVQVPTNSSGKHPVIIFLHGAGGSGNSILNTYSNHFENYIKVALDGYLNKWNIKSEPTKADDISFIGNIISQLKSYSNVDTQRISLLGLSNGAGLVIKALIELPADTFNNGIHIATQLTEDQYRNNKFWFNEHPIQQYSNETSLPNRNKIISFHGTSDSVIPYAGGPVNFLNSVFYDSHESIYTFAKELGYENNIIANSGGDTINPNIKEFSYLNHRVVHYKVLDGSHGLHEYMDDIIEIIYGHIE